MVAEEVPDRHAVEALAEIVERPAGDDHAWIELRGANQKLPRGRTHARCCGGPFDRHQCSVVVEGEQHVGVGEPSEERSLPLVQNGLHR